MSVIFRRIFNTLQRANPQILKYSTVVENQIENQADNTTEEKDIVPIISKRQYDDDDRLYQKIREVWIENFDTVEEKKLGLMSLHPHVYATAPRMDMIHQNVRWQKMYRWVVSVKLFLYFTRFN